MTYQRKTKPALWTQTPKGSLWITEAKDCRNAKRAAKAAAKFKADKAKRVERSRQAVPRKRVPAKSDRQRQRDALYVAARAKWWPTVQHMWCPVMLKVGNNGSGMRCKVEDCHHIRGKLGSLYWDVRYFLPVSRAGHAWIDANRNEARKHGWLALPGDWNRDDNGSQVEGAA